MSFTSTLGDPVQSVAGETGEMSRRRRPNIRLDEEGFHSEEVLRLKKSRAGYTSRLTKLYREMESIMVEFGRQEEIEEKKKALGVAFNDFKVAHDAYCDRLDQHDEREEAHLFYNSKLNEKLAFDVSIEEWLKRARVWKEKELPVVEPGDSASMRGSVVSRSSRASSIISLKTKQARAKQEVARLRMRQLERQQEMAIERETIARREADARRKEELLKTQNEVEVADLEARIWNEEEEVRGTQKYEHIYGSAAVDTIKPVQSVQQGTVLPDAAAVESGKAKMSAHSCEYHGMNFGHEQPPHENNGAPLNPNVPEWNLSEPERRNRKFDGDNLQQLFHSMTSAMKQGFNMPRPELITFDGTPTNYWKFIRNFETNIDDEVQNDRKKLTYLIQTCTGEAREYIEDCVILPPEQGYQKAKQILHDRFGRPHIIAHAYVEELVNGPPLKSSDGAGLLKLSQQMQKCELTLTQMGYAADMNNSENLLKIMGRLPLPLQCKWAERAETIIKSGAEPNFSHLAKFVQERADTANNMYGQHIGTVKQNDRGAKTRPKGKMSTVKLTTLATQGGKEFRGTENSPIVGAQDTRFGTKMTTTVGKCPLCSSGLHELAKCEDFIAKSYGERVKVVRQARICDNCFQRGHFARNCMLKKSCQLPECNRKHQTLLHPPPRSIEDSNIGPNSGSTNDARYGSQNNVMAPGPSRQVNGANSGRHCNATGTSGQKVCLRVVPVQVRGKGRNQVVETYALIDDGSDVTLCDEHLVDQLGLEGVERSFTLSTLGNQDGKRNGVEVELVVMAIGDNEAVELPRVWTVDKLPISRGSIPKTEDVQKWPHLQDLEFPRIHDEQVMLLIGADVPEAFWVQEERRGKRGEPYAVRSLLGWTLIGPTGVSTKEPHFQVNFVHSESELLHRQVERFWKTDFGDSLADSRVSMSVEDKRALSMMEGTITKVNGHYQVALPWRNDPPCLTNNRRAAEGRLRLLKGRFLKDKELFKSYSTVMDGYITKGYARKIPKDELQSSDTIWYLPHHPVFHPQKPGKTRVVFDCAAKFRGTSLNDQLFQGPDLTNSLVGVLIRFRQESIALVADVEAMFHQVRVDPKDLNALRFLWWPTHDLTKEPEEHQMMVHVFGATSSPSCANFCLRKTAADNKGDFDPEAAITVERNFYVDDCLKSVTSREKAIALADQLQQLLSRGGFRLTKWLSNDKEVLSAIPEKERASSVLDLDLEDLPVEHALGVEWDIKTDKLGFRSILKSKPPTRRGILSVMSSVYDPLGLAAPFILPAKLMLQTLCKQKIDWDQPIGDSEKARWNKWLLDLAKLSAVAVDRCYKAPCMGEISAVQLHHFCDASQLGYGTVSYLRQINTIGTIHCAFVIGKSRLAPMKAITIPRLELSAAVLAVKQNRMIQEELDMTVHETIYWTDSTSVLQYIKNETKRFSTFVSNRLAIIHDGSSLCQWRHVDSKSNPADDASRGMTAAAMIRSQRWLKGPDFLWKDESYWPTRLVNIPDLPNDDPEVKRETQVHFITQESALDLAMKRCSSWNQLLKGVAWLLRYKRFIVHNFRSLKGRCSTDSQLTKGDLSAFDLREAEREVVSYVQRQAFQKVIATLENASARQGRGSIKRLLKGHGSTSSIYKLDPKLEDGLLRVGGRLENAPMENDAKHPVLLPHDHHVTRLIIEHYHSMLGHSGRMHVLSQLRERFWIVKGSSTVKRVIGNCFDCRKRNATPCEQFMANLPKDRLNPDKPPFTNVGIDYFGPLYVKQGRANVKRYGCLFSCLTSRAVHIEISHSLDTDSFIGALRRFISRRGNPEVIRSDNGTNLHGGERELREAIEEWNQRKINENLRQRGITWIFNPPAASHMGGVWERMIRSVRKILKTMLGQQLVSDETLLTLMAEVEGILNSRPLTQISDDPKDAEPLTPNHLLLLRPSLSLPPGTFNQEDRYSVRRWRQTQFMADLFWKRWMKEYLPLLQERQKWCQRRRNLAEDDLVLLADENTPRGLWPLGRVLGVHRGQDGSVRSVKVKTKTAVLTRPVTKLCFLEGCGDRSRSDGRN